MTEPHPSHHHLDSRLRAVWRRGTTLHLTAGALAFCRWGLLLFLAGMALDWLADVPGNGRVLLLVTILAVSFYKGWQAGWRHLRRFDPARTALRLEKHHGGLESLLVTAVQLGKPGSAPGASEAMRERTCRMADDAAAPLRPEEAVPYAGLRHPALAALVPVAIVVALAIANGPFLAAGAGRIFAPWLALEYPTRTRLAVVAGDRVVKEGDPIRIRAEVDGVIPSEATLTLRTGKGKPRERTLPISEGACEYGIESVFRSFEYRLAAGDARSAWHSVRVISSPRIEHAEVRLDFPPHTRRPAETVEALTLTVPEGTRIRWKLVLDRAVREAEFRPAGKTAVPLDIGGEGRSVTMQQVAAESRAYSFGWVGEERGFAFDSPRHYVQVAPDQPPGVDLTSPGRNLYATLGRELALAFRARDDHGIGEVLVACRVNKTGEEKVSIPAPERNDGSEQGVDWDYREALPDLAIGDTVSFAVEVADRYPGPDGPHRARSDARRVQFLSKEDYLAQIEKQKRRLLTQVRTIYREERGVHDLVRGLDPSDEVFVQSCQLEAVRQDLIRERLGVLRNRIDDLVEDLAANKVSDEAESAVLVRLGADLQRIGNEHVGRAAARLRELAAVTDRKGSARNPAPAVHMVDSSARELGLVVLQLGFEEAADIMARELHATAQTQSGLRLRTVLRGESAGDDKEDLAAAQTRLANACARLLAATPRNKESTSKDALVAFQLSRLVNELLRSGTDAAMHEAAALITGDQSAKAARLQAGVIAALLRAEFRLRRGAEYEALTEARKLFTAQAAGHENLREKCAGTTPGDFEPTAIAASQAALHRRLQLLLMPEVPAPRPRLLDAVPPPAPPVDDLLAGADKAMQAAVARIAAGDREAAAGLQSEAATAFTRLAEIVDDRMEAMTREARVKALVASAGKQSAQLLMLEERLLALLEQTEDAADDDAPSVVLATQNQAVAAEAERFRRNILRQDESGPTPRTHDLPLVDSLRRVVSAVSAATSLLEKNRPDEALEFQEQALDALEEAAGLIEELTGTRAAFAGVLADTANALAPSPLLAEIESEQRDLTDRTGKSTPEDRPALVIPQKNLIHAVNAVLASLDPLAHKIESGTVMLFAKEDMDAAAIGLETDDVEEALDAQSYVVETLEELRAGIDDLTPQYRYVREIVEFLYETVPESAVIRTGMRQAREDAEDAPDAGVLKSMAETLAGRLDMLTGEDRFAEPARRLAQSIGTAEAEAGLGEHLEALAAVTSELQLLMENLAYLIAPPPSLGNVPEPTPKVALLEKVLDIAGHHHDLHRKTRAAARDDLPALAARQRKLESRCAALIPAPPEPEPEAPADDAPPPDADPFDQPAADADPFDQPAPVQPAPVHPGPGPHPRLVAAHRHLSEAAAKLEAGDRDAAVASQHDAGEILRHFILDYALRFVQVPPPAPPADPAPSDDAVPEDSELQLFMPGALTGTKPKGGRLEWQVLGRRDRAALNENFARELPLEYRAILKEYYERLTE